MDAPQTTSQDQIIRDLTMLVLKLSKYAPEEKVNQAFDYLHRKSLASPLRSELEQGETSELVKSAMVSFWMRLAEVERARADTAEALAATRLQTLGRGTLDEIGLVHPTPAIRPQPTWVDGREFPSLTEAAQHHHLTNYQLLLRGAQGLLSVKVAPQ